jgi:glycosyltransferase involved in cell wall biosynthesis
MGCGVPVVAYDSAGPAEIVKDAHTGYLAAAGDWETLASKAIEILEDDELRAELGGAAKKDVRSRFAADLIAYRVMKVYGLEI